MGSKKKLYFPLKMKIYYDYILLIGQEINLYKYYKHFHLLIIKS